MARRNPGISPILSARGYAARVLWPKYTPSGGVNSGSEVPFAPSNTLQTNMSNLVTHENPFKPITEDGPGRIAVTSKRGKTLYMTPNQIMKMGSRMLAAGEVERALGARSNPFGYGEMYDQDSGSSYSQQQAQADHSAASSSHHQYVTRPTMPSAMSQMMGPMRRNPVRQYVASADGGEQVALVKAKSAASARKRMRQMGMAEADSFRMVPRGSREVSMDLSDGEFPYQHHIPARSLKAATQEARRRGFTVDAASHMTPGMHHFERTNPFGLYEEIEPGIVFEPEYMDSALDNPRGKKRAGNRVDANQRRLASLTRQAEAELAGSMLENPRTFRGAQSKAARSAKAIRKSQDRAISRSEQAVGGRYGSRAEALGVRQMESEFLRGYYGARKAGHLPDGADIAMYRSMISNPRPAGENDAKVRRAGLATKLKLREDALAKLNSGMSHNDVRASMGLTYPVYMMVLRSHWTK